jgi:cation diffusion facilitator CzcD-associated flavoprotein CzcO
MMASVMGGAEPMLGDGGPGDGGLGDGQDGARRGGHAPRVLIIGTGFGGLGAAVRLREVGVEEITLLERADAIGGTWRDNTYPGAACDIPAHLYSFSFALKSDWSSVYPRQEEIRSYLEDLTDSYGLRPHIRFGAEVIRADFDGSAAVWRVATMDGRTFEAEVLIAAPGPLSEPRIPDIPGRDTFRGTQFHSARWEHDVDLAGRRVGVIGTGASSIQFVPHLADRAGRVSVFQRSAPWIIPRLDREYSDAAKTAFRVVPGLQRLYRALIYAQKEVRFAGFRARSRAMRIAQAYALWNMRRDIEDPGLRAKLAPDYSMGCKRVLISSDYYPALARRNVEVVTEPIERITPAGIALGDGREVPLDILIWGTGFDVRNPVGRMEVRGLGGRDLTDAWDPHPVAYHGTTVPGFPNLFLVLGPNTGLGHNSMIYMMESQYDHILAAVRRLSDPEVAYVDVTEQALERFIGEVNRRNDGLVWSSGCRSWYLDDDGYNFALWPGWTFEYRRRVRDLDEADYRVVRTREPAPSAL